jgi:hypothetical protein
MVVAGKVGNNLELYADANTDSKKKKRDTQGAIKINTMPR